MWIYICLPWFSFALKRVFWAFLIGGRSRSQYEVCLIYCWWKKSCTSWYGKYGIMCKVLHIPGGDRRISEPSTAWCMYWKIQQDGVSTFLIIFRFFGRRGLVNCQWAYHMLGQRVLMRVDPSTKPGALCKSMVEIHGSLWDSHQSLQSFSQKSMTKMCILPVTV